CDTAEPSPLAHEIINARPYAFLDDAPLEERRTQAVQARRTGDSSAGDLGRLDADAIDRVRDEARPDPRDVEELHDALLTAGFLFDPVAPEDPAYECRELFAVLAAAGRVTRIGGRWIAAERLPEMLAVHPDAAMEPIILAPATRTARSWTREEAIVDL